jgi:hypothetical protein
MMRKLMHVVQMEIPQNVIKTKNVVKAIALNVLLIAPNANQTRNVAKVIQLNAIKKIRNVAKKTLLNSLNILNINNIQRGSPLF